MILTGFQTGHRAQSLPHTALEPWTHMGAIICKVAAVAPGNDLKQACACVVCACVCDGTWSMHKYIYFLLSHSPISSKWQEKSVSCRGGDMGRLLCCLNPKLFHPLLPSWKRIIFSSIVKHLNEMFMHTFIPLSHGSTTLPHVFIVAVDKVQLSKSVKGRGHPTANK